MLNSRASILRSLNGFRRPLSSTTAENASRPSDRELTALAKAVAGIVVLGGSGLGVSAFAESGSDSNPHIESKKKPKFLFGDSYRRRVFLNYEKRIRMQSPPEKIFEYFASFRSPDGEVFMSPADLMRAVVPVFPPSESDRVREGFLRGEHPPGELQCAPSDFFMLFDTNNDGLISFPEYIFFVTLLSIPESSFSVAFKMFDLDHNGQTFGSPVQEPLYMSVSNDHLVGVEGALTSLSKEIEREEFRKVMALMRSYNRQGAGHRDGRRFGLKVGKYVENGGLLGYFFGEDGKGCLNHDTFVKFLRDLHDEIVRLEFAHYDYKSRGTICAKDFALSMVASADINHINKFLDRVDELDDHPHLRDIRITFEEFKALAELRKSLQPLTLAIFSYGKVNGLLTKQDFQRAASHVCGISVSDNVVDLIFHVFDTNRNGILSYDEFLRALQRWESDVRTPNDGGISGLLSCWLKCTKNCSVPKMVL